ncbi:hypothetical protein XV93_04470 [Vibrio metoecus]|nr:hypothetical protein XV93_04470 [Vibrio metoecus]
MVTVVVFEFSVMRCQPLRRALCHFEDKSDNYMKEIGVVLEGVKPFELAVSSSTDWPTVLVGLGTVCTTFVIAYITRSNQKSQSKAKAAELKNKWLEDLRLNFAEFLSQSSILRFRMDLDENFHISNEGIELAQNISRYVVTIKLMLNKESEECKIIESLMDDCMSTMLQPNMNAEYVSFANAIEDQANKILDTAWNSIKQELGT